MKNLFKKLKSYMYESYLNMYDSYLNMKLDLRFFFFKKDKLLYIKLMRIKKLMYSLDDDSYVPTVSKKEMEAARSINFRCFNEYKARLKYMKAKRKKIF